MDGYKTILRNRPGYAQAGVNYASCLLRTGHWEEAKAVYARFPNDTFALMNVSLLQMYDGEIEKARVGLRECLRREPTKGEYHHDLAVSYLINGEWKEGWDEYEWRWLSDNASWRPDVTKQWTGQQLSSCLVIPEQGMGDNVQFIRYAQFMKVQKRILIIAPERQTLFARTPFIESIPMEGTACAFAPIMSLPKLTGYIEPFWPGPYIVADGKMDFGPGFKVGICWKGNPAHKHDSFRSMKEADFDWLKAIPGITVVSLQVPGNPAITTYSDTAKAIAGLDLVITVDTSVAHIAGAMGKDTWVLISRVPDWRWRLCTVTTPWYPSVRLYRQEKLCDWSHPIARMKADLNELMPQLQIRADVGQIA